MNKKSKLIIISISAFLASLLIFISIFFGVKYYQKKKKAKETADLTLEVKKLKDEYQELKKNFEAHYHEINNYNDLGFSSEKEKEEFNFIKKTNQNKNICNNKAALLDQKQCLSNLNSDFNHANTLLDKTKQKKQQISGEINDLWSDFQTQKEKAKENIDEIKSFDLSIYDDETKDKFNKCIEHFELLEDSGNDVDDFDTLLAKKEHFQQLLIGAKENQNDSKKLILQYQTDKENFVKKLKKLEEKNQSKMANSEAKLSGKEFNITQCYQNKKFNDQKDCLEEINRNINKKNLQFYEKELNKKNKYYSSLNLEWFGLYNQYDVAMLEKMLEVYSNNLKSTSFNDTVYSDDSAVEEIKDKFQSNLHEFSELDKYFADNIKNQIENINETNVYKFYSILKNNCFFNCLENSLSKVNDCVYKSNLLEKSSNDIDFLNKECTQALYKDTLTSLKKYVSESIKNGTRNVYYLTSSWLKASFHAVTVLSLLSLSFFGFKLIRTIVLKEFLLAIINTILIINQPIIISTLYLVYLSSWFKTFIACAISGTVLSIFLTFLGKKYFVGFQNFWFAVFAIIQTFNFIFNFGAFYVSSIFGFHQYEGLESYLGGFYVFDDVEVDDVEVKEKKIVKEIAEKEKITKKNIAAIAKQDQEYAVPNWFIPKRKVISFIVSVFAFTTSTLLFIYLKFFSELSKVDNGVALKNANIGGGAGGDVPK